jgi:hypothetical protein
MNLAPGENITHWLPFPTPPGEQVDTDSGNQESWQELHIL